MRIYQNLSKIKDYQYFLKLHNPNDMNTCTYTITCSSYHNVPLFFQFTDGDDSENAEERERRCNRQREALIQFKEDSSSDAAVVDNVTTTTTGICGSRLQGI